MEKNTLGPVVTLLLRSLHSNEHISMMTKQNILGPEKLANNQKREIVDLENCWGKK